MKNNEAKPVIMIVDDEENVLKSLFRELQSVNKYHIETYNSGEVAIKYAQNTHFDLLITDYKMPWMHGLTVMKKFTELQPHAPTIIISGYIEKLQQHCNFNEITIPYLLDKPWQKSELLDLVNQAMNQKPAIE